MSKTPPIKDFRRRDISIDTKRLPIRTPKVIKAKTFNIGGTSPDIREVLPPNVEKNIPAIRYGAGTFVFCIKKPPKAEKTTRKNSSMIGIVKLLLIACSKAISLVRSITIRGVVNVKIKTLVDWITAIFAVSPFISVLILNTKLRCPGDAAKIEDFLSSHRILFKKYAPKTVTIKTEKVIKIKLIGHLDI